MRSIRALLPVVALVIVSSLSGCSTPAGRDTPSAGESPTPTSRHLLLGESPASLSPSTDAPVTLVEFADYECPPCGMVSSAMVALADKHRGKLSVVVRNFPLTHLHANATMAAQAAEAARMQGKFPEMYEMLFARQGEWAKQEPMVASAAFERYGTEIGLDTDRFNQDRAGRATARAVEADQADGRELGVDSTPTLFLNGELLTITSLDELTRAVDAKVVALG